MSKGKNFEREISKDMSLWLTNGQNTDCIWYTKSSGGRATRRVRSNQVASKYDHGDLGPDGSDVEYFFDTFSCELKTGYGTNAKTIYNKDGKKSKAVTLWSVLDLLDSSQQLPIFYNFWSQAVNDADESGREPLLIFRRNRRLPCIAMRNCIFDAFVSVKDPVEFDYIKVNFNGESEAIAICNIRYFYDHTWGKIDEYFIKLKINRTIMLNKRKYHEE